MISPDNPFETEYAKKLIEDTANADDMTNSVWYTNEICFETAIADASDEDENDDGIDDEFCYEIWAAACLYDSMLNGTDYSRFCMGYEDSLTAAVKRLEKDISKKKFLSKKPVYDLSRILQNAVDALDAVIGISADSELAERMKRQGVADKFERTVFDLQNRLSAHIEE